MYGFLTRSYPGAEYHSVYEAGFCGFWIHERLTALGIDNIVVNPADVPTKSSEKLRKTDTVDSGKLARSLRANELKGIYTPVRQRAGIARTLAMNPKVILMDEPFSAVDHLTKCTLQEELINIRQAENKTVLFVTHDINEAVFLADRVVLLSPRPSTIQKIYEIPLEQKRGRSDPLLLKIAAEIAKDINSGGQEATYRRRIQRIRRQQYVS